MNWRRFTGLSLLALAMALFAGGPHSLLAQQAAWLSGPPGASSASPKCPDPNQWYLLYWGGTPSSIDQAARACAEADRFWSSQGGKWLGYNPAVPQASDTWTTTTGEAAFVHSGNHQVQAPSTPAYVTSRVTDFRSGDGVLHVVGEVKNTTNATVEYPKITATFFDAAGNTIGTHFAHACLTVLAPGGDSPFDIAIANPPANIARYAVKAEAAATTKAAPNGLSTTGVTTRTDSLGQLHVVGKVANAAPATYDNVKVCAAFYNAAGDVIRTDLGFTVPGKLRTGESGSFDIPTDAAGVASNKLWVGALP
jgi:hypothetical protein